MVPVEAECLKLQNVKHVKIGKSRKSLKQQGSLQKLSNNSSNVVEIRISFTVVFLLYIWLVYRLSQQIQLIRRDFLTAYCWSSKGDGVDLLYKVINNDVVTGRWCFTVVTTADTNDW